VPSSFVGFSSEGLVIVYLPLPLVFYSCSFAQLFLFVESLVCLAGIWHQARFTVINRSG